MQLEQITPLILTFNEASNLNATLEGVRWAKQIVIVDSGSTDETLEIAARYPQVTVHYRKFDHFAEQCNFGLEQIKTEWVLSLDADYRCPMEFEDELRIVNAADFAGFQAAFRYCVYGRPLRSTLYPPRTILYQQHLAKYVRDGHAHRVTLDGKVGTLKTRVLHDDHKPLQGWFLSQIKYAQLEADKLSGQQDALGWKDRIRKKIVLAPMLTFFYCLFAKGLLLDGPIGWYYTSQRVLAELMLSLALLDKRLRKG